MRLEGKTVLITGGRRVGSDLAVRLASRGANIAMTYLTSRGAIEATVARVREVVAEGDEQSARTSDAMAIKADLSDPNEANEAVRAVRDHFGSLDVLVNMASVYRRTPWEQLEPDDLNAMIAANLAAPYHTAIASAKWMLKQPGENGVKGKIVNFGDWATDRPYRDYLPYLVSKGALKTMTLALAKELAPHVHVNMIQPAMIDPPPDLTEQEKEAVVAVTPLRRIGSARDVNELILYMIEGTDFMTGMCVRVDGGRFLGGETGMDLD